MSYKFRILEDITNHCKHPSIEEMLKYDLWEFHEALYVLTSWPDYIIKADCTNYSKNKNIPRTFFYEAAPPLAELSPFEWRFDPRQMSSEFITAYNSMRDGVAAGQLEPDKVAYLGINDVYGQWKKKDSDSRFEGSWTSWLFSPSEVINWALTYDIYFSEELQKAIGINLIKGKLNKSTRKKVEIKIVGQLLRCFFPSERASFYCEHKWMEQCIEKPEWDETPQILVKDKCRLIRNYLDELRDPNRTSKKGNRSEDDIKNEPYTPLAIKEVTYIDEDGLRRYHIPSLEVAITKAAHLLIQKFMEESPPNLEVEQSRNGLDLFLNAFMEHEVIALYIKGGPAIEKLVRAIAYEAVQFCFI
jgi:hypothetical protein